MMMKKCLLLVAMLSLAACAGKNKTPEPAPIGFANPASVYCKNQGGRLDIVKEEKGEVGYCTLPSGERIEEWALYRRAR